MSSKTLFWVLLAASMTSVALTPKAKATDPGNTTQAVSDENPGDPMIPPPGSK
ncbi:MAG: hypothetical protein H3C35_04470 [Bacteroidetes bacterium]|nr:hypothetical protein [Bacteroidota bacterium]